MKLHKVRSGTKEAVEQKEYTICVGISLGNKWFTTENIIELIEWCLQNSKNSVVVCPADDIHAINLEVRNRVSKERALTLAKKMSDEMISAVKAKAATAFNDEQRERIVYATWADVVTDEYKEKVSFLYKEYEQDSEFRDVIQATVRDYVSRESRDFSEDDIHKFSTYLLEEMPEVINRVPIKNIVCDAYVYPFDSAFVAFIEDIQKSERFPRIKENIMDTEPKVFLEVR